MIPCIRPLDLYLLIGIIIHTLYLDYNRVDVDYLLTLTLFILLFALALCSRVRFRSRPPVGCWVLLIADKLDF